jgi:hypothetical protein
MASAFHWMIYGKGDTYRNFNNSNSCLYKSARIAASESKMGKERIDMKGKKYFGASEENIKAGTKKMVEKKTGMKILNYPSDRKSSPCSDEKASKIALTRLNTKNKFIEMTDKEFNLWCSKFSLIQKNGRPNSNITRAIKWRKESC